MQAWTPPGGPVLLFTLVLAALEPGAASPAAPPTLESVRSLVEGGRYLEAECSLRDLLPRIETSAGTESREVAEILDLFVEARLRSGRGTHSETLDAARRAVAVREAGSTRDPEALAAGLHRLAMVLEAHGHASAGNRHYQGMAEARERQLGESSPDFISTLTVLGVSFLELGDPDSAGPLLDRALRLGEAYLAPEDPRMARILAGLAWVETRNGNPGLASAHVSRAEAIYEVAFGSERLRLARSHAALGDLLLRMGSGNDAKRQIEKALALWEVGDGGSSFSGRCLGRLASIALEAGDVATARLRFDQALPLLDHNGDEDPGELAELLAVGARISEAENDLGTAEARYGRARALFASASGAASPETAAMLSRLAVTRVSRGDTAGALDVAIRSGEINRAVITTTALALPERQALLAAGARSEGLRLALSLAMEAGAEDARRIWDSLIRSRGRVLDELAIRNRTIYETSSPALARLYDDFSAANAAYAKAQVHRLGAGTSGSMESLRKAREHAEAALAERSLVFRRSRAQSGAGYDEVKEALPADAALVAFVRTEPEGDNPEFGYLAFVMRPDREYPAVIPLGAAEALERLVDDWGREMVAAGRADRPDESRYLASGRGLREAAWSPLADAVSGLLRVFIVPDGELHRVSFATLPEDGNTYLIETGPTFHYLSTERDLAAPEPLVSPGGLLAVGGAAFDTLPPVNGDSPFDLGRSPFRGERPSCTDLSAIRFEDLPASRSEIEAIAAMWSRRPRNGETLVKLVGADATEAAFKRLAPGKSILHLATHGFFLKDGCGNPAPGGQRGIGKLGTPASPPTPDNPLTLAGLALAGANLREETSPELEDGILTAEEIAALDLHGVRWVVLSACDTGLGEVHGSEGVFGLRRAFQVAGVETLIMSLWPVGDEAARRWMESLYAIRFFRDRDTAEAVREASVEVLRENRRNGGSTHPFFWGAFVATGSWR